MNTLTLLDRVPWALLAMVISARLIPYLSALATDHPSWWTGTITDVLSFAGALLAEYAQQPNHFDWSAAVLTGIGAWAVASLEHSKKLKGTHLEGELHRRGAHIGKHPAGTQAAA